MKYWGINTGESRWSRSWKALQPHLPNTGKMNDRANIAGNVVLATDLLLINTKLPSNPPYISLSAHTLQRRPAQTSGKEKDHQDLAPIPRAAPPARHFSWLPPRRTRAFLPPTLLESCLESASRTYGSALGAKPSAAWTCWSPRKAVGMA